MKKIAAVESFFSPEHRVTLEKTAAECGFAVDYYPEGHLPADRAAEYEVIYGLCPPCSSGRPASRASCSLIRSEASTV